MSTESSSPVEFVLLRTTNNSYPVSLVTLYTKEESECGFLSDWWGGMVGLGTKGRVGRVFHFRGFLHHIIAYCVTR